MVQNDERRRPSFAEVAATSNLAYVVHDRTYRYHPDIVVKAFNDLDTVFFGGRLHGNVIVSWANSTQCAEIERGIGSRFLGSTTGNIRGEQGQARIFLNPREIFLENLANESPLRAMFCTLLHEVSSIPFLIEAFRLLHADFKPYHRWFMPMSTSDVPRVQGGEIAMMNISLPRLMSYTNVLFAN